MSYSMFYNEKVLEHFLNPRNAGEILDDEIVRLILKHFDPRPAAIIDALDLRRPIYKQVAAYGHFGRLDLDLPWEKLDKAKQVVRNFRYFSAQQSCPGLPVLHSGFPLGGESPTLQPWA